MNRREVEETKYPKGTKIRLIHMEDPNPISDGTLLTVDFVDDAGQIHVVESGVALIPSVDELAYVCSTCGTQFTYPPATSRLNGKPICRKCSAEEALDAAGITNQAEILGMI